MSASVFASVVMLCDDFFTLKLEESGTPEGRFYQISKKLPMELQMILCNYVYSIKRDNIPLSDRETAFKDVFRATTVY